MITSTHDSAHDGAHQSLFAGQKTWENGWRVLLNPINQTCVSVGVELKRSEPGPLQNAAHLCFRLQAVSRSALTLVARPARRFSFPRLPGCKQFAMNSFKTVGRNNNNTLFIYLFFCWAEQLKAGVTLSAWWCWWMLIQRISTQTLQVNVPEQISAQILAYSDELQTLYLRIWPREKHCQVTNGVKGHPFFNEETWCFRARGSRKEARRVYLISAFVLPVVAAPRRRHASFISLFSEIRDQNGNQLFSGSSVFRHISERVQRSLCCSQVSPH